MNRVCRAAVLVLLAAGAPAPGQQPPEPANLRGDSAQTRKRLAEAEQKLLAGKTADATDDLQRVLDEAGDDLITVDSKQYRPARWVAHQILAKLPADALKGYRDRIDEPARKLLDTAKRTRDPAPLWQLLDRYFVSRPADEALLVLGDLLFERGQFRAAERMWRRLVPDGGADVAYPGSNADLAAVRARVVLAVILQGDANRAKAELIALKAKHPAAKGLLAGKDGPYADVLQAYLDAPPARLPANRGTDWPEFGGGPNRSGRVGVLLPPEWPGRPTWKESLPASPRHPDAPASPPNRPPFGHPVVTSGQVFVTDGLRVFGFDLLTGKPTAELALLEPPAASYRPTPDACPTLTAAGDRLYARLGPATFRAPNPGDGAKTEDTVIVCLGPVRKADGTPALKELWRVKPPAGEGKSPAAWEGAPLVAGRRLWAAYARFEGGRVVQGVACFDPADGTTAPDRPAWTVDVCDSPASTGADARARHELLTLAGRNVVFCSNAGAVVALDATTGRRAWGFRYTRSRKADANHPPDPAPAVCCAGVVFVAPPDADRVYFLDPESGAVLWECGQADGAQILGVSAGRLVVAVSGPTRGLRAFSVLNRTDRLPEGWTQSDGGGVLGYGRGFVTDDVIVWPTRSGLYFLDPKDGRPFGPALLNPSAFLTPPEEGRAGYFGNVVYADGVLVVVTPTQVWGYVSEARRFGPSEPSDRDPARDKFERLTEAAERALTAGQTATARELLLGVARGDLPGHFRAWAAARLLLLTPKVDEESKLPDDLRAAVTSELRGEWLIPPDGIPVTLGTLIDRHLGRDAPPAFVPSSPTLPSGRRPEDAPTLPPDAEIDRSLRLAPGSAPLRWVPGAVESPRRLFVTTATELLAIPLAGGNPSRHEAAAQFTHAAEITEGFVAAGPLAVAVYGTGRAPLWVFRVPTTDRLPARAGEFRMYGGESPPVAELSSFRLVGSWLLARLGDRHLIALDLRGKRVAWLLGAGGRPEFRPVAFPDAVRFGPEFTVTGRLVVVQLSDGRRWFVRAETGKVLDIPGFGEQTAKVGWTNPPAEAGANRLAVADGPGLVRVLDLATGRVKWSHRAEGDSSLAGDPPQVRAWGDVILIAIRRNHGIDLDRIDPADGKSIWRSGGAFLDADRVDLANADADAERVYVPAGNTLSAFALKDGRPAWEAELPDARGAGGWVVRAGQKCVIVYPEAAIPREPVADVLARVVRSFRSEPAAWRLPGLAAGLYDAWVARTVPVLLFDPETGKQLGKVEVPAAGPAVTAWFERDVAAVATGDRVVWLR